MSPTRKSVEKTWCQPLLSRRGECVVETTTTQTASARSEEAKRTPPSPASCIGSRNEHDEARRGNTAQSPMEACVLWCVLVGTRFLDRAKQKSEARASFSYWLVTTRVSLWETTKEHAKRPNREIVCGAFRTIRKHRGGAGERAKLVHRSRQIHPREFGIA